MIKTYLAAIALAVGVQARSESLVFQDDFNELNFKNWQHEITLGGGGNWEFQIYWNNRSNSWTDNGVLYLKPTFTADYIGEANLRNGYTFSVWGG